MEPSSSQHQHRTKVIVILAIVAVTLQQVHCLPVSSPNSGHDAKSAPASASVNSEKVDVGLLQQPRPKQPQSSSSSAAAALIMGPLSSMISQMRSGMRQIKRRDVAGQDEPLDDENVSGGNNQPGDTDQVFYPMLISKKSASALNKLIYALKTSLDSASLEQSMREGAHGFPLTGLAAKPVSVRDVQATPQQALFAHWPYDPYNPHLQRRNQQKDRKNYLRCYFNAVSCF